MKWKLPDEKKEKTLRNIEHALSDRGMSLKDMQVLMGRLNDVALMCPFLKTFKAELNGEMAKAHSKPEQNFFWVHKQKKISWFELDFDRHPRMETDQPQALHASAGRCILFL